MIPRTFHCSTFGCQMSVNDSEWLARALCSKGFSPASFEDADMHIITTCSVRNKPEQKVYSLIGAIAKMRRNGNTPFIVVGGCVAQQVGEEFFARFPHTVRLVYGTDGLSAAPEAISRLCAEPHLRLSLLDFADGYIEYPMHLEQSGIKPVAAVSVMQGCDNYCAYCIVPYVRGQQRSRQTEQILAECRTLLAQGTRDITLLGQNVNSFGQDVYGDGCSFPELVYTVAALPGLERLRLMTSHPKDMSDALIQAFADLPVLAPRLHLPLQSGSDRVLAAMGRRYDMQRYMSLVEKLYAARPDLHLSTDIIVGFPGESEADFQATLTAMQTVGFTASYSFIYSDRPGTRAALLPRKLEKAVSLERLNLLLAQQSIRTDAALAAKVGQDTCVLLENISNHAIRGEQWQGKDLHGYVVNMSAPKIHTLHAIGKMVPVRITHSLKFSLLAEQVGAVW